MAVKKNETPKVPNPVVHAIVGFLSHSASWSMIVGVVLAFVAVFAPTWAGREELQTACNQLGLLLAAGFSVVAGTQKIADGLSKGRTSAFTRHGELVSKAEERAWEEKLARIDAETRDTEVTTEDEPEDDPPADEPPADSEPA